MASSLARYSVGTSSITLTPESSEHHVILEVVAKSYNLELVPGKEEHTMRIDEFGNEHLQTSEFSETVTLKVTVEPRDEGGSARVMLSDKHGFRYGFNLGAEAVDELIVALNPILSSKSANWPHVWVQTPNPKHDPEV
jgi:hypothetical protein